MTQPAPGDQHEPLIGGDAQQRLSDAQRDDLRVCDPSTAVGGLLRQDIVNATQYLDEAHRLAQRVAVIDGGRVVAEGTPAELKQRVAGRRLYVVAADAGAFDALARALEGRSVVVDVSELRIGVPTDGSAAHVRALLDGVDPSGRLVERFAVHTATLDDVFVALTGHAGGHLKPEAAHV